MYIYIYIHTRRQYQYLYRKYIYIYIYTSNLLLNFVVGVFRNTLQEEQRGIVFVMLRIPHSLHFHVQTNTTKYMQYQIQMHIQYNLHFVNKTNKQTSKSIIEHLRHCAIIVQQFSQLVPEVMKYIHGGRLISDLAHVSKQPFRKHVGTICETQIHQKSQRSMWQMFRKHNESCKRSCLLSPPASKPFPQLVQPIKRSSETVGRSSSAGSRSENCSLKSSAGKAEA